MRRFFAGLAVIAVMFVASAPATRAYDIMQNCDNTGYDCKLVKTSPTRAADQARNLIVTALGSLASLCVLMIIVGGFKYVTSQGDAQKVQSAKNTILYSVIGLVVAVASTVIVYFVANSFK